MMTIMYLAVTGGYVTIFNTPMVNTSLPVRTFAQPNITNGTVYIDTPAEFFAPVQLNLTNDTLANDTLVNDTLANDTHQCPVNSSENVNSDPFVDAFGAIVTGGHQLITTLWTRCQPILAHAFRQLSVGVELAVKWITPRVAQVPMYVWCVLGFVCVCFELYTSHWFFHRFFPVWYATGRAFCWRQLGRVGAAFVHTIKAIARFLLFCLLIPVRLFLGDLSGRVLFYANLVNAWCKRDPNEVPVPEFNVEIGDNDVKMARYSDYRYIFENVFWNTIRSDNVTSFNQTRTGVPDDEFFALHRKLLLLASVGSEDDWAVFKARLGVSLFNGELTESQHRHAVVNLLLFASNHVYFKTLEDKLSIQRKTAALAALGYVLRPQAAGDEPAVPPVVVPPQQAVVVSTRSGRFRRFDSIVT